MGFLLWCLKQLLPLTYWTRYSDESGQHWSCIWRQWFGRSFAITRVAVSGALAAVVAVGCLSPAYAAICTPDLSREECIERQVAGRAVGAKHRLYLEFVKILAASCEVDPATKTGSCSPPTEWFTSCDEGGGCTLEVELGK